MTFFIYNIIYTIFIIFWYKLNIESHCIADLVRLNASQPAKYTRAFVSKDDTRVIILNIESSINS